MLLTSSRQSEISTKERLANSMHPLNDVSIGETSFPFVHNSCYALKQAFTALFKTEDFLVGGILGSGYFATVVLAKHRPTNRFMALKISHDSVNLSKELDLLNNLDHPNVLTYYGACVVAGRLSCALEFAEFGSLVNLLSDSAIALSWNDRITIANDIALGIKYLHDKSLIHRDLSSHNILIRLRKSISAEYSNQNHKFERSNLLDIIYRPSNWPSLDQIFHESFNLNSFNISSMHSANFENKSPSILLFYLLSEKSTTCSEYQNVKNCPYEAIVGDVGLVLDLSKRDVDLKRIEGNPFYTAPECLNGKAPYSTAADIFSYGLLICELITGLVNDGYRIPRLHSFALDADALPMLSDCPDWLFDLARRCCQLEFAERPTIDQILQTFRENRMVQSRSPSTQSNDHSRSSLNGHPSRRLSDNSLAPKDRSSYFTIRSPPTPECCNRDSEVIKHPSSKESLTQSHESIGSMFNYKKLQFPKRFTSLSIKGLRSKMRGCSRQITVSDFRSQNSIDKVDACSSESSDKHKSSRNSRSSFSRHSLDSRLHSSDCPSKTSDKQHQ